MSDSLEQPKTWQEQARARNASGKLLAEEAIELTGGERNHYYGRPRDNLKAIAVVWQTYLRVRFPGIEITNRDVCWMMTLLKAVRDANNSKRDNPLDGIGYLELLDDEIGE